MDSHLPVPQVLDVQAPPITVTRWHAQRSGIDRTKTGKIAGTCQQRYCERNACADVEEEDSEEEEQEEEKEEEEEGRGEGEKRRSMRRSMKKRKKRKN